MLRLRKQVGSDKYGTALTVRHYKYFTRSRYHIDGNKTENLTLRLGDKSVSGAYYLIDLRYGFGAVRQRRHRLRPAGFENPVNSGYFRRRQYRRIYLAVCRRGRGYADFLTAGNLRGYTVHQHGGGVRRSAARNIKSHLFNRRYLLTGDITVPAYYKAVPYLCFMELPYIFRSFFEYLYKLRLHKRESLVNFFCRDLERGELCPVKLLAVVQKRLIAAFFYIFYYIPDYARNICRRGTARENFLCRHIAVFHYLYHCSFSRQAPSPFLIFSIFPVLNL